MSNQILSHNACYGLTHVSVPLMFNSAKYNLGFSSTAHSDFTTVKYSFYERDGLYWYSVTLREGFVINSLFFVGLANCVRDFRCLCDTMCWEIDDSLGLSKFVSLYNNENKKGVY